MKKSFSVACVGVGETEADWGEESKAGVAEDEVDGWDTNVSGTPEPNVTVNGKKYTKAGK